MASLQSLFPKAVNVLGERKDPERSLWRNVLIVALEDAIGKGWKIMVLLVPLERNEHKHISWNRIETLRWCASTQVSITNIFVTK